MRGRPGRFLGITSLMAGASLHACGGSFANPNSTDVAALRAPSNLQVTDGGNGAVVLSWIGDNSEYNFDGYNVYGMKGSASSLGVTEGQAITLFDSSWNLSSGAASTLANFNYNPSTKMDSVGSSTASADPTNSNLPSFSAYPIYAQSGSTALLPTCKPKSGTCGLTTSANENINAADTDYATAGSVAFQPPDLMTVGDNYCFFVVSSETNGHIRSQVSSNVACAVSNYSASFNLPLISTAKSNLTFDLTDWLATCTSSSGCSDPTKTTPAYLATSTDSDATGHKGTDAGPLYIELIGAGPSIGLVAGKNSAVLDLGYFASGFADTLLPKTAPTLQLGTALNASGIPIANSNGYAIAGEQVPLIADHMYIIAVGSATASTTPTTFHYVWLYISGSLVGTSVSVEMRLPRDAT